MIKECEGWKVKQLEVVPGEGIRVTLEKDGRQHQFLSQEFGVGGRRKSLALAKFAAESGLGDVEEIYHTLRVLPRNYAYVIPLPLTPEMLPYAKWKKERYWRSN